MLGLGKHPAPTSPTRPTSGSKQYTSGDPQGHCCPADNIGASSEAGYWQILATRIYRQLFRLDDWYHRSDLNTSIPSQRYSFARAPRITSDESAVNTPNLYCFSSGKLSNMRPPLMHFVRSTLRAGIAFVVSIGEGLWKNQMQLIPRA